MTDNTNDNDENIFPEIRGTVGYIKIDKREIQPIHQHDHEHQYAVVADSDDQNEVYVDTHCTYPGCPMGKLMKRSSLPETVLPK